MKVKPLIDVLPVWDDEDSDYPDAVRIAMEDGNVITYRIDRPELAEESFKRAMEILRSWPVTAETGYQAKHIDKKERRRKWFSCPAQRK